MRGLSRNLGDPVVSSRIAGGQPANKPRPTGVVLVPVGAKTERTRGNRGAKETKRGGMGDGKSEQLVVPRKLGNSPARTQWREGAAGMRNRERER